MTGRGKSCRWRASFVLEKTVLVSDFEGSCVERLENSLGSV